jgi:RNA recognition motif-containing protein
LDSSTSEDLLRDFFMKYYTSVTTAKVIIDPVNKTSKGYGFVKFSDPVEAQRALTEMSGKYLNGKSLKCKYV